MDCSPGAGQKRFGDSEDGLWQAGTVLTPKKVIPPQCQPAPGKQEPSPVGELIHGIFPSPWHTEAVAPLAPTSSEGFLRFSVSSLQKPHVSSALPTQHKPPDFLPYLPKGGSAPFSGLSWLCWSSEQRAVLSSAARSARAVPGVSSAPGQPRLLLPARQHELRFNPSSAPAAPHTAAHSPWAPLLVPQDLGEHLSCHESPKSDTEMK